MNVQPIYWIHFLYFKIVSILIYCFVLHAEIVCLESAQLSPGRRSFSSIRIVQIVNIESIFFKYHYLLTYFIDTDIRRMQFIISMGVFNVIELRRYTYTYLTEAAYQSSIWEK